MDEVEFISIPNQNNTIEIGHSVLIKFKDDDELKELGYVGVRLLGTKRCNFLN